MSDKKISFDFEPMIEKEIDTEKNEFDDPAPEKFMDKIKNTLFGLRFIIRW